MKMQINTSQPRRFRSHPLQSNFYHLRNILRLKFHNLCFILQNNMEIVILQLYCDIESFLYSLRQYEFYPISYHIKNLNHLL